MQAVILAAGKGTRLLPITQARSKAMVPVLGRPLVELAAMPFVDNGIHDFIFVISRDDTEITDYFESRCALDIAPRFVIQEERLGMAHALGLAAPLIRGRFVVSACDSLIDSSHVRDLLDAAVGADAVLSLLEVEPELVTRSGVVELRWRADSANRGETNARDRAVKQREPASLRLSAIDTGPSSVRSSRRPAANTNFRTPSRC